MVINGLNLEKQILTHTQGDVENGRPNGVRIMTTKYGEKYLGKWKNAAPNGQGTLTVPNGSKYIGEWKMTKCGISHYTTKTETSLESGLMENL